MSNHWATPDELMAGLISCLDLKLERFASPLNFHTGMNSYFAVSQEDVLFGANIDAYSMPWLGASQANPEYEPAEMEKAVRWAVMSAAHTEEASITAFILPDWARTSYYKYMADPRVHRVAKIPKQHFRFKTPDFWKTGKDFASNPKWNINIFLVANAAGLSKYDPNTLQQTLQQALPGFLVPNLPSRSSMLRQLDLSNEHAHLSKGFKKILNNDAPASANLDLSY